MTDIEVLESCKNQFDYHTDFINKCIDIINNKSDKINDVKMFCDALQSMFIDGKFSTVANTTIWAYRNRMRM